MAQPVNLVPNGSFEDTIDFGNGAVEPKLWDLTLGSPNYFSPYFKFPFENAGTPYNFYGYQIPKDGKAYMGILIKYILEPEQREYIQIKLKSKLIKDTVYNLSFWINMPDSLHWTCEQKNIAFSFTNVLIDYPQHLHKRIDWLFPIYKADSTWNPANKTGWEKFIRTFKASGNEEYLIVGNFLDSNETKLVDIGGGIKNVYHDNSYYFIDDIKLYKYSEIDTASPPIDTNEIKKIVIPNIFTPNADGINDVWKVSDPKMIKEISIYNRWGDFIKKLEEPGFIWEGTNHRSGLYYYKVVYMDKGVQKVKTGSITLMR